MANPRNFLLQSFALEAVKTLVYPPGKQLQEGHTDMSAAVKRDIADLDYNMTTMETGQAPLSMLGTPVFADIILRDKSGMIGLQLLWALLEVNMTKNIVKTSVQGRPGTVKEYISDGDYQVTIRGGLFSPFSNAYPKDDVLQLMSLLELNQPLDVISEYLNVLFNINCLVVEDYSINQKEGVQNVQLFEIKTVSDLPITLQKKLF